MMQECMDELLLLSDMLATFAKSDGGVPRAHGESISKRIRQVAERLRHSVPDPAAAAAQRPGRHGIASPLTSSCDEPASNAVPRQHSIVAMKDHAQPPGGGATAECGGGATPRLPAMPGRQPGGQSPRVGASSSHVATPYDKPAGDHRFTITKPNSVRVVPIPRESVHTGPSFEATRAAACALYNILENITWLMHSTTASVYIRDGEEMVSIVNVSPKLVFPPKLLRHACHGSLSAGVLASGITLNQRTVDPRRPPTSTMIVPIFNETSSVYSTPIAVVQMEGKHQGRSAYSESDELTLCFGARLLGLVIGRFRIDWLTVFHDPMSQHNLAAFRPPLAAANFALAQDPQSPAQPLEVRVFADALDAFVPQKFVKRVVLPMNAAGSNAQPERVQGLGPAPTLKEIDSYVNNLHDCWKKSVEMNVTQSHAERQRMKEIKSLREDLSQQKTKHTQVSETLRIHMLDSADYKKEYQSLREELEVYLRSKDRMD